MKKPLTIINEILSACSGCEISLIDLGTRLFDIIQDIEIIHFPLLIDNKYSYLDNDNTMNIPSANVAIISGAIRNSENLDLLLEIRKKCQTLIALGTCATSGGIPALANSFKIDDLLKDFSQCIEITEESTSDRFIPPFLERCYALDEYTKVDIYIPGCPPHPDNIYNAIKALIEGEIPMDNKKSVCDSCPTVKLGKKDIKAMKRFLSEPNYNHDEPLSKMRCFLEQGFLCMGPVTKGGCGGDGIIPLCIKARVPCQGCYGPIEPSDNQRLGILNALASNAISTGEIPNTDYLLAFSGAHNRLKPKKFKR